MVRVPPAVSARACGRLAFVAGLLIASALVASCSGAWAQASEPSESPARGFPRVAIHTSLGLIVVELLPTVAPNHVTQFLELIGEGFYDGTTFHRVVPGFVIQGGDPGSKDDDPDNDGYGGLEERRLKPEFSERQFTRGSVGMARDYRLDGASCQFFISLGRNAHLDRQYTLFGRVVEGMEVVDRIAALPADERGRPANPPAMTVRVLEEQP